MAKKTYSEYKFVDVSWEDAEAGRRSNKWKRILMSELDQFRNDYFGYNSFCTIQRFKNPLHAPNEPMYIPLYFDIDSSRDLPELIKHYNFRPESDDKEKLAIDNFKEFDIELNDSTIESLEAKNKDNKWNANLEISKRDAIRIVEYFNVIGIPFDYMKIYFSGKKGFHILISPQIFDIKPSSDLNQVFKFIALYLNKKLNLQALDYGSIYSSRRMLRLPNSVHQGTGLHKIQLTYEELTDLDAYGIRELAKAPRKEFEVKNKNVIDPAKDWFWEKYQEWEEAEKLKGEQIVVKDTILKEMKDYPACVQDILDNSIKKSGDRNKATMALASYFKDIGLSQKETEAILIPWAEKIPDNLTSANKHLRKINTITVVKSIYEGEHYHFACPFIKSLHGGSKDPVACGGKVCPLHEDYRIEQQPAEKVHLSDTAKAEYTNKKVVFDCLVSGKLDAPYIVPKKVVYRCPNDSCQKSVDCDVGQHGGVMEKEFHDGDRFLIEAPRLTDKYLVGILKQRSGTPGKCDHLGLDIVEYVNIEELLVVPMAERIKQYNTDEGEKYTDEHGKEYVARKIYYANGKIHANKHYRFEGFVYPHPKTQFGTVLANKGEPKQDSIDSFELTEEMKESFKVFQQQPGETIEDRAQLITDDLANNVTNIWERNLAMWGILMVYHSPLSFYFQNQLMKRGWLETVIVGDTGMGKTQMVERFIDFCGLSEMISGESASRTGITYRLEQSGDTWFISWGRYPLNDKKLLVLDELTGLEPDDFGKMTEARSSGVLRVDRVVNAETNARTRLIMLTNPRYGKQISEFMHPVESLKQIFPEAADIRRLDFAIFMGTKDVSKDVLNRDFQKSKKQLISSQTMHDHIQFVWSRKPEDFILTEEAEKLILKKAHYMGEKYGSADDIPLVSPADQRNKLARLAHSCAAVLHSVDETGEKIVTTEEHVEFVCDYLEAIYDDKNFRYNAYTQKMRQESDLTEEEKERVQQELAKLDYADVGELSKEIVWAFANNDLLKPQELQDMFNADREIINARIAILVRNNFIKRTRNGFKKLPKFVEYIEQEVNTDAQ